MVFGVIGGDRRQSELAALLRADGHRVLTCGHGEADGDAAFTADAAILPLPLCVEGDRVKIGSEQTAAAELFSRLTACRYVFAGLVDDARMAEAADLGVQVIDYFQREELTVANAAATAEATVQVLMEHMDRALLGANCLILGFGRIGKFLARRLSALGARVTATARKSADLAWIRACGYEALETGALDGKLGAIDAVINTVPAPVMGENLLRELPSRCILVDVASVQGIDLMTAQSMRLQSVWARALPGRLVPRTAAEIIRDTVYQILREEGAL